MNRTETIRCLRERVGQVAGASDPVEVGLAIGRGLRLGRVHEWFGAGDRRWWSPPLLVLADAVSRAVGAGVVERVVWVGRACWPYAPALSAAVVGASVFIDPPDDAARLWAVDAALRSRAPVAVVGDGRGLTLAHTRRLQLSAAAGGDGRGGLCLLARPAWERGMLSGAATRWGVDPAPTPGDRPRWTVALLRDKDRPASTDGPPRWVVEWDDAQGLVRLPAAVAGRAGHAAARAS